MKRTMKNVFGLLIIALLTSGFAHGQEKKEKQHIKIVVSGTDGKQVEIDTTFSGTANIDTIKLSGGKVVISENDDNVMTWVSTESDTEGKSVIYVHKGDGKVKNGEVRYNVKVVSDEPGTKTEKTSYVVAKDGMVVTIEGNDEEKVKDMAATVESILGVTKDSDDGRKEVNEATKKTGKK
jgi:hypothetical protein